MQDVIHDTLAMIPAALKSVKNPRLYESERGFQGELLSNLREQLPNLGTLRDYPLVEQEYQKRLKDHGLTIRPDIIIHCPFEQNKHESRSDGNLAVFELKLRASRATARIVYERLITICDELNYQLGIFINIGSRETHYEQSPAAQDERIMSFSVSLNEGRVEVNKSGDPFG